MSQEQNPEHSSNDNSNPHSNEECKMKKSNSIPEEKIEEIETNQKESTLTKFPPPLRSNPSDIKYYRKNYIKSFDTLQNSTKFGMYTNAHFETQDTFNNIPNLKEFEIVKNFKGEFEINDGMTMSMVSPTLQQQLDGLKINKTISHSPTDLQKKELTQQPQQKIRLQNKQVTESIIFETQSVQSSNNEQVTKTESKNQNNAQQQVQQKETPQPDIENRPKPKERIPLLTLSKEKPILKMLTISSNNAMKAYTETDNYYEQTFCCGILFRGDCCLKWIADFIFKIILSVVRFVIFLFKAICIICSDDEIENEKQSQTTQSNRFMDCFYCPIECCCGWVNQFFLSIKLYICQGLWWLPQQSLPLFNTCNQTCLIQCGMFFKNCCFFKSSFSLIESLINSICLKPFHLLGECLQSLCTPQGLCEQFLAKLKKLTCNMINSNCLKQLFFCCSKSVKLTPKNNQEIIVNYCFGCAIETTGYTLNIEENL